MSSPSLFIRRLVVEGELGCDLKFERGINIVWAVATNGDPKTTNTSGKTALVELIQHGLGKKQDKSDSFKLTAIREQIRTLWLEIELDGEIYTIRRSLQNLSTATKIFHNVYTPSLKNANGEDVLVESMPEWFMQKLNIPLVQVKEREGQLDPLSFRLLMHTFILHQEDSFQEILIKVQPKSRKQDIIGFITRITPIERFTIDEELSKAQQELERLSKYYTNLQDYLEQNGLPNLLKAKSLLDEAQEKLELARQQQLQIQQEIKEQSDKQSSNQKGRIENLRHQILEIKEKLAVTQRELSGLQAEEERLVQLVASLESDQKKNYRLRASSFILSSIEFSVCPRCMLDITPEMRQREEHDRCLLCNRPIRSKSDALPRAMPRLDDIKEQLKEVAMVLNNVQREKENSSLQIQTLRTEEAKIGHWLDDETKFYVAPSVDRLVGQSNEVARLEVEFARAQELFNQAEFLANLKNQVEEAKKVVAELEEKKDQANKPNQEYLNTLRKLYADILQVVDFLDYRSSSINAYTFMPTINDSVYTTQGTAMKGLATVCYHLALLNLSLVHDTYFPRMLVIDSPATGDLNDYNHEKLLEYLAHLQESEVGDEQINWQIILTTRKMIPQLRGYVIDQISAPDQMLLRRNNK